MIRNRQEGRMLMKCTLKKILTCSMMLLLGAGLAGCVSETEEDEKKEIEVENKEEAKNTKKEVSIEEQLCFEYEGLTVTAMSMEEDDIWGTGIKFSLDNQSDKNYSVGCEPVIVNNCMITNLFSAQVAAGKKANETLYFSESELEEAEIKNIGQVELYFYVYDSESYERLYETDCIVIKTSLYDEMEIQPDDSGTELYNDNGVRIVGKYVNEDSFWGCGVLLYIENHSGQNITVRCEDLSINGYMVDEFFSSTVYDGKYAIDEITIMDSDLEENDITSVDNVELEFEIENADTYDKIAESGEVSFNTK